MQSKSMTRKEFVTLTITLIGGAALGSACSSSSNNEGATGGTTGTGTGGSGGINGTGGTNGAAGANGTSCMDPLPETQVADSTGHVHTVTIPASDLNSASGITINTSTTLDHMHTVTLAVADLGTLKGGGTVTVTSSQTLAHMHMFRIGCTGT
jgi:hypothetical protein